MLDLLARFVRQNIHRIADVHRHHAGRQWAGDNVAGIACRKAGLVLELRPAAKAKILMLIAVRHDALLLMIDGVIGPRFVWSENG
ncbi:hypothetical protein [Bradyrhizobium sp. USDA 4502]